MLELVGEEPGYPVEVEEISYEEYLALQQRGETFEEPLGEEGEQLEILLQVSLHCTVG